MSQLKLLAGKNLQIEAPSYSSPQFRGSQKYVQSPVFRASFDMTPVKARSDSSEMKEPTISNRKVSILSQISQLNYKEAKSDGSNLFENNSGLRMDQDDKQNNEIPNNISLAQTTKNRTFNWKEKNGLPKHVDLQQIVRKFWNKLKKKSQIWEAEFRSISLLEENYVKNILIKKEANLKKIFANDFLSFNLLLSYIALPIFSTYQHYDLTIMIVTILLLFNQLFLTFIQYFRFKDKSQMKRFAILSLQCIYIGINLYSLMIYGQDMVELRLGILVASVLDQLFVIIQDRKLINIELFSQIRLVTFSIYTIIYINLITNLLILVEQISDSETTSTYFQSLIWVMNNMLPFNPIETEIHFNHHQVEQIFALVVQVLSILLEVYSLFFIVDYYYKQDQIEVIQQYFTKNQVSSTLSQQAIDLLHNVITKSEHYRFLKVNQLMSQLPFHLSNQIQVHVKSKQLKRIKFFHHYFSQSLIERIAEKSDFIYFHPNDIIVSKERRDENLYLIIKGKIGEHQTIGHNNQFLRFQSKDYLIGLDNLFLNCGHQLMCKSYGHSIVMKIPNFELLDIIRKSQADQEVYHNLKYEVLFNQRFDLLFQHCSICNSNQHLTQICSKVHFLANKEQVIKKFQYSQPNQRIQKERKIDTRINSLSNFQTVRLSARRYRRNNGYTYSDHEEQPQTQTYQYYDETIEEEYEPNIYSYKEISNPNVNIERQKSAEIVSGQTLKDLLQYHNNQNIEQEDIQNQYIDVNRHQAIKSTVQTAGFQEEYLPESMQFQHKTITQNSNTFKSSSGQTYQSQRSNRQQQPQQKSQFIPTSAQLDPNKYRIQQPKLTFSYDPLQSHQTTAEQYQQMLRPQIRSSTTNYVQPIIPQFSSGQGLPIVSEESSSQLNIPFTANNIGLASAISLSSVGMASIDDNIRRDPSYTGFLKKTNKQQTNTNSAVSPGHGSPTQKRSASNSYSQSYLSSQRYHYLSDFDEDEALIKSSFDIDRAVVYDRYKPLNNYNTVVNQLLLGRAKNSRNKK